MLSIRFVVLRNPYSPITNIIITIENIVFSSKSSFLSLCSQSYPLTISFCQQLICILSLQFYISGISLHVWPLNKAFTGLNCAGQLIGGFFFSPINTQSALIPGFHICRFNQPQEKTVFSGSSWECVDAEGRTLCFVLYHFI